MILIRDIDVFLTDTDIAHIIHCDPNEGPIFSKDGKSISPIEMREEICKGRTFHTPNGEEVVIANSQKVQDIIGIQYDSWDALRAENSCLSRKNKSLRETLASWENSTFSQRLKWLFFNLDWLFKGFPKNEAS